MAAGPLRRWLWITVIFHSAIVITDEFPRGGNPPQEPELESSEPELESTKQELESKPMDKGMQSSKGTSQSDQSSESRVNFCATEACVKLMLEYEKTQLENGSGIYPGRFGRKK